MVYFRPAQSVARGQHAVHETVLCCCGAIWNPRWNAEKF